MAESPHIVVFGRDTLDGNRCAGCDRAFSQGEWPLEEMVGTREHGRALYDCPTEGCDGTARVIYAGER